MKTKAEAVLGDASLEVLVVVVVDLSAFVSWDLISSSIFCSAVSVVEASQRGVAEVWVSEPEDCSFLEFPLDRVSAFWCSLEYQG